MTTRRVALAVVFVLAACATAPQPRVIEAGELVTAFTGVTLISEYGGARLTGQTVAVRGDRIIAIAADDAISLPIDVRVIDGADRLLAPGLADMHTHYVNPEVGALFLANSVTTVRNPSGGQGVLELIAAIAAGERSGPFMYASGQVIDGPGSFWGAEVIAETAEAVRARVRADAAAGYRAIKLYGQLTPEQFAAGIGEARAHNLQVYAHVPRAMSVEQVFSLRIDSIEHLDAFERSLGGEGDTALQRWASVRTDGYESLAAAARDSGVWNTPTLIAGLAPARAFVDLSAAEAAPEMRFADAGLLAFWRGFQRLAPGDADPASTYPDAQRAHATASRCCTQCAKPAPRC